MEAAERLALVEQALVRAAEKVGDVTAPAMERYYRRFPEVKASFEAHCLGDRAQLEGEMVQRALYCLMYWFESPGEVEIMLTYSVLHHHDTLHVRTDWYAGLIDATADVIVETIPPQNGLELGTWEKLRGELREVVENCRRLLVNFGNPAQGASCPAHALSART